MLSLGAACGL